MAPPEHPSPAHEAGGAQPPLVVVPTYEERETLPILLGALLGEDVDVHVLVVDDDSPDGTGRWAQAQADADPRLEVLHRPGKQGLGAAYRAGLGWGLARGHDVLVEMDADLSHDPAVLPELLAATREADLVIGSRWVPGGGTRNWPWHRRALSRGGNLYVQLLTGLPVRDATAGYRAFRAPVLEAIGLQRLRADGYSFQVETALAAHRAGFRIVEVPIIFSERTLGASKMSRGIVLEAMRRVAGWGIQGPRGAGPPHPESVVHDAARTG